ncbi:MAG: tyrosine--tRNA ligase [Candidatus Magasanikbacteria bacterium]
MKDLKEIDRYVEKVFPSRERFRERIKEEKLKIYLGIDPTGAHLHLGHATNLLLLKKLQEMGHKIIFLIGDFTARIGDPTGKEETRNALSEEEIKKNMKSFQAQASKIIDFEGSNPAEIKFNSEWLDDLTFRETIEIASNFTIQQMIKRDMFQKRLDESKPIRLHEFLYPLMQGYDSVAMEIDAEVGGTDQTFNMLIGKDLLEEYKEKEKLVITTKLLEHPKDKKKLMSQSEGETINLDDSSSEMFGQIMSLDDEVMFQVAKLSTEMSLQKIQKLKEKKAKKAKMEIAFEATKLYYKKDKAQKAKEEFKKVFEKKEEPEEKPQIKVDKEKIDIVDLIQKAKIKSRSKAKRLINQGAVKINGQKIKNFSKKIKIKDGDTLQIGKKRFFKLSKN